MERDTRKVRVGLIGLGRIADLHARAYRHIAEATLAAVCDLDPKVVNRRRREWGVAKGATDYRALLDDPEIDAVEVLTPHHLHRGIVCDAAAAGKHVAVQKPMALTVAECDAMIDACARAGVVLKVTENFMFHPPYRRAKELIEDGAIGEPRAIRLKNGITLGPGGWEVPLDVWIWRLNRDQGGPGPITFDDGYHKLNCARYFLGEVTEVSGWIEWTEFMPGTGILIDAPACFSWKYETPGRYGVMDVTMSRELEIPSKYYPIDEQVEITGDRGVLYLTRCTADMTTEAPLILYGGAKWTHFGGLDDDWAAGFRESARNFARAVRGDEAPALSGAEGKRIVQFAHACYRAAESGGWVRLDDVV
ncbi:MAG: Gfo/Idh/MocA family oxidoreductase [Myxococcales bacterium]|nr:Gfo/Idh/MocA family oxidoreductase [Myxococcales bacterium]